MGRYFKECKKHNVSPLLLTKIGEMKKEAPFPVLAAAMLAATLGFGGHSYFTMSKEQEQISKLQQQVAGMQKKQKAQGGGGSAGSYFSDLDLDKSTIGGGVVGGGLGAWLGPKIMPKTDEVNARIIGGLGGALAGGVAGSALKEYF